MKKILALVLAALMALAKDKSAPCEARIRSPCRFRGARCF